MKVFCLFTWPASLKSHIWVWANSPILIIVYSALQNGRSHSTRLQYRSIAQNKTQVDKADISTLQIPLILYFNDQGNGFPCVLFISAAGRHLSSETYVSRDTKHCVPLNPSNPSGCLQSDINCIYILNLVTPINPHHHLNTSVSMAKARATPPTVLVLVM